jgi:osmotically-inducible protein OsmY
MELLIGACVLCQDGEAGRLRYVVVDPVTDAITDLIVEHGHLLKRNIVVPLGWVARSDAEQIVLDAALDDLKTLPIYREVEYMRPDPTYRPVHGHRLEDTRVWMGPYAEIGGGRPYFVERVRLGIGADESVLIQRGLRVFASDGHKIGTIHHLVADEQHRLAHVVIRGGDVLHREYRMVPVDQIETISEAGVQLKVDVAALEQAPRYHPPASDTELQTRAEQVLQRDQQTKNAPLMVSFDEGVATLQGIIDIVTARAAQRAVERIRGVLGVIDETTRPPAPALTIGAPIAARDGRYGTLKKVVIDPHARRVTHLVVGSGWLATEQRVVPIERVERVDADGIHLNASAAELNLEPVFREEAFITPDPDWEPLQAHPLADTLFWGGVYPGVPVPIVPAVAHRTHAGVPEDAIMLQRGADVLCDDALVGTLDHLLIDPQSGQMTHFVVEELRTGRRVIVPQEWVRELHEQAIVLHKWMPERAGVPVYAVPKSAAELTADVRAALGSNPELAGVDVTVEGGVAHLHGNVPSVAAKADADMRARNVPGIVDIANVLTPDTALTARITAALADDPATNMVPIEVISVLGVVTLQGAVPTVEIKDRAEQIARHVPGVRMVINALEVRPPEPDDLIHVWPAALVGR